MSKFRKSRLSSAMLCTLLFGGNAAGAIKKDMSKVISKNDLSTKDKELENRKPDDSGNKFLKYALYFLGLGKLADEGVGFAEAKDYIDFAKSRKLSPLGKLSIYKNLVARSYKTKTIETMRNLVAESYKNAEGIKQVFDGITEFLTQHPQGTKKVEGRDNVFDVTCGGKDVDIKGIFDNIETDLVFESLSNYVKAVLGVSVEQCDKILVNLNQNNKYIAFVKDNVCLNLTKDKEKIRFMLCTVKNNSPESWEDYSLHLDSCYSVTRRYMFNILGIKNVDGYSFYGLTFDWLYGKFYQCKNKADAIFPDLFSKKEELIELKEE